MSLGGHMSPQSGCHLRRQNVSGEVGELRLLGVKTPNFNGSGEESVHIAINVQRILAFADFKAKLRYAEFLAIRSQA